MPWEFEMRALFVVALFAAYAGADEPKKPGDNPPPRPGAMMPEQIVDSILQRMDTNKDGTISLEEYKQGALKNPDIIQGLKLFA